MTKLLKQSLSILFFIPKTLFGSSHEKNNSIVSNLFVFLLLAFLGFYYGSLYFFNPFDNSWITVVSPLEQKIQNPFGEKGAFISSFSIYYLGTGSWFFPLPLFVLMFFLITERFNIRFLLKFLIAQITFLTPCLLLLTYHNEIYLSYEVDFLAGGAFGLHLTDWFIKNLGIYGAHLFAFMSLWFSYVLLFDLNFISPKIPSLFVALIAFFIKKIKISFSFLANLLKRKKIVKEEKKATNSKLFSKRKHQKKIAPSFKNKTEKDVFFDSLRKNFKKSTPSSKNSFSEDIEMSDLILKTLSEFNIKGKMLDFVKGPSLITYHFRPEEGVRQSKVLNLVDDLALALKVQCIMIKPAVEKRALGIQVPRHDPELVSLGDILNTENYIESQSPLTLTLGLSEKGEPVCEDLAQMPHLLLAGSTGSGKSVCLNTFICSILTKASPKEVRFLMIDPKMLELSVYNTIPHLLAPVVTTDLNKAKSCLNWAVYEMERRYSLMEKKGVRDLAAYNQKLQEEKPQLQDEEALPFIVIIIDELADLMLMAAKDIESLIQRLTQKARACGIHLILATQRPSVDVVTGIVKANLPCRMSFRVVSRYDSKTILDQNDAEKLLGKGDMLFMKPGVHNLQRIQGAYVSGEEVTKLVKKLEGGQELYDESVVEWISSNSREEANSQSEAQKQNNDTFETLYEKAIDIARTEGVVSTSFLQRRLSLGYNRAAKIIEKMEGEALISGADGSKKRKWLKD